MAEAVMEVSEVDLVALVAAGASRWGALAGEVSARGRLELAPSQAGLLGDSILFEGASSMAAGLLLSGIVIIAGSSSAELDGWIRIIAAGPIIGVRGVTTKTPYCAAAETASTVRAAQTGPK
jgi:hypothetical protein